MKISVPMMVILGIMALIALTAMFTESPEQAALRQLEEQGQMMQQESMNMLNNMYNQNSMQMDPYQYQQPAYPNSGGYPANNSYQNGYNYPNRSSGAEEGQVPDMEGTEDWGDW